MAKEIWGERPATEWENCRSLLKRFLWWDVACDSTARAVWDEVNFLEYGDDGSCTS